MRNQITEKSISQFALRLVSRSCLIFGLLKLSNHLDPFHQRRLLQDGELFSSSSDFSMVAKLCRIGILRMRKQHFRCHLHSPPGALYIDFLFYLLPLRNLSSGLS